MEKEKEEEIFITYAKASLKDNPEVLYEIFEKFKKLSICSYESEEIIKGIIGYFARNVKCKNIKQAEKKKADLNIKLIKKGWKTIEIEFEMLLYDIALEGIFGYKDGFCESNRCHRAFERKIFLGDEAFIGPERLQCYECSQFEFRKILEGIVAGKEYSEIGETYRPLEKLINLGKLLMIEVIKMKNTTSGSPFKEEFSKIIMFNFHKIVMDDAATDKRDCFEKIFYISIVGTCLSEFLLNNDRRKLKRCLRCEKFFVAQKLDERIKYCSVCSYKSLMTEEQRKKYMRKYRAKKRKEKDDQRSESKIKNLMDKLGCTRKEAIEIIRSDLKA